MFHRCRRHQRLLWIPILLLWILACLTTGGSSTAIFQISAQPQPPQECSNRHNHNNSYKNGENRKACPSTTTATSTTATTTAAYQYSPPPPPPSPTPAPAAATYMSMRAWTCHGKTQRDLVDRMVQAKIVQSPVVQAVLNKVDRVHYSPNNPYDDAPQGIGLGQTISAPHMHAHVLEEMLPVLQQQSSPLSILDVGCGSGYLTACLGRWMQDGMLRNSKTQEIQTGHVYGIDIHSYLVDLSQQNIMAGPDRDLITNKVVQLQQCNGWNGWPEKAPFDAIHVGAAAADFPRTLATQLKVGGVLIVPVGPVGGVQNLYRVDRIADHTTSTSSTRSSSSSSSFSESDYRITELLSVRYVPLIQGPGESRSS